MPLSPDIDDYAIRIQNHHGEDAFAEQVIDQFERLHAEADRFGGRLISISLHPWMIGQPYRIGALETALDRILGAGGIWCATGADILAAWAAQQ